MTEFCLFGLRLRNFNLLLDEIFEADPENRTGSEAMIVVAGGGH